jgi:hypothetical protein
LNTFPEIKNRPFPRRKKMPLLLKSPKKIAAGCAALGALALVGCSDASGPLEVAESAPKLAATTYYSGRVTTGSHTNLLDETVENEFEGTNPMAAVTVNLRDQVGNVVSSDISDTWGGFDLAPPAPASKMQFVLADGRRFGLDLPSDMGPRVAVRAKIKSKEWGLAINVELFTDNDGDGKSDDGTALRIRERMQNNPTSGTVTEEPVVHVTEQPVVDATPVTAG